MTDNYLKMKDIFILTNSFKSVKNVQVILHEKELIFLLLFNFYKPLPSLKSLKVLLWQNFQQYNFSRGILFLTLLTYRHFMNNRNEEKSMRILEYIAGEIEESL